MEMVERRDTSVTRHVGGWIVLGAGLLLVCLRSALFIDRGNDSLTRSSDTTAYVNIPLCEAGSTAQEVELAGIVTVDSHSAQHSSGDSRGVLLDNDNTIHEPDSAIALPFPQLRIDLNTANQAELSCIEGVGPALAQRIINFRKSNGGFTSLQQLDEIPGVGPKLAAQLKAAATINVPATSASKASWSSNMAIPTNLAKSIAPVSNPTAGSQPVLIREHSEQSLDKPSHD